MKRIFYYTTTAIIISCGITQAQTCVPTPTCSSLGYTSSTACDGGLKCPFGEAWYCPSSGSQDMTELCSLMGYTRTCTGSNQTGGSGKSCNGLYKDCSCDYTSNWNGSSCICKSTVKYTCTSGAYVTGGSGISCGGKYTKCSCSSPYAWNSSSGSCVCAAEYTCTGNNETGGVGPSCNGKYAGCSCKSGYYWSQCNGCIENGRVDPGCGGGV